MEMLPNDVRQHRFRKSVRGYDTDEVDQFVEHLATVLEEALGARQQAEEKVKVLEKDLRRFRDQEDALKKAVLTVEHAMAQARESTAKEGEALKRAAEQKARQIIHEAELERRRMENDLRFLKESRRSFLDQIRAFYYAQLKTLESIDGPDRAREAARQAVQPPKRTPSLTPTPPPAPSEAKAPPEAKTSPGVRALPDAPAPPEFHAKPDVKIAPVVVPPVSKPEPVASPAPKPEPVPTIEPPRIEVEQKPIVLEPDADDRPVIDKPQADATPRETRPWEPQRIEREEIPVRNEAEQTEAPTQVPKEPEPAVVYPPPLVPERKGDGEQ
jgi:cell division initiation protein